MKPDSSPGVVGQRHFRSSRRDAGSFRVPTAPSVSQALIFKPEVNALILLRRVGVFTISFRTLWMQRGTIHL